MKKKSTFSIGFTMNISDHISNQRHYLKVMLRCARMYHSQIEKTSIKNCHKLNDFRHCFYRCVSLYRSSVFNISKRLKAFFPWKKCTKNIAEQKFDFMHPESAIKSVYYSLPLLIRLQYTLPLYIPVLKQLLSTHTKRIIEGF